MVSQLYIPFTCPHCGSFTEVEPQFAGQSGPCYSCGKPVTVPYLPPVVGSGVRQGASLSTIGSILAIVAGGMIAFVTMLAVLMWVLGPAIGAGNAASQKKGCDTNLKQIAVALDLYYQKYNVYPPAYTTDAKGRRLHSWRVLILPYLGEKGLYDQFDLSQPWDSTNNFALTTRMPAVFACPADQDARDNDQTSYVVVVGRGTAFPGSKGVAPSQITDGLPATVLVVESHSTGIYWSEPKDLDAGQMLFLLNGGGGKGGGGQEISSRHPSGAHVLTADGKVHFIQDSIPAEYIEASLTIAGKDIPPPELHGQGGESVDIEQ